MSVGYWFHMQGTPQYVAMRGARALFEDPGMAEGMPWQTDEFRAIKLDEAKALNALQIVHSEFLQGAQIVDGGEFHKVTGKDAYFVRVATPEGAIVEVPLTVIDQDGKGVMQFGDLIVTARLYYYEAHKARGGDPADKSVLNAISNRLVELGIPGYFNIAFNELEPWKSYEPAKTPTVASN